MATSDSNKDTADKAYTPKTDKKATTTKMSPAEAARTELHAASLGMPTIAAVFGDELFDQWVAQVRSNPAYRLPDPDNPADDTAATNSSGSNPPPALIVQYGDGPNDYISTVFDAGQVIVQDGNDPTGKAWKYPETAWRRFVARVRGDELSEDEREPGMSQYEEAALFQKRTNESIQADRDATDRRDERAQKAGK